MDIRWASTPSGTWVCVVGAYHGIVCPMDDHWAARVEDGTIIPPGEQLFPSVAAAKAWVEQTMRTLQRPPDP